MSSPGDIPPLEGERRTHAQWGTPRPGRCKARRSKPKTALSTNYWSPGLPGPSPKGSSSSLTSSTGAPSGSQETSVRLAQGGMLVTYRRLKRTHVLTRALMPSSHRTTYQNLVSTFIHTNFSAIHQSQVPTPHRQSEGQQAV